MTIEPLDTDRIAAELADREAIRDCLARYARGMDMLEPDLVRSAYWPDARHNGTVQAGPEELIANSIPMLAGMDNTMHLINAPLIRIEGKQAAAETYFFAFHRITPKDGSAPYHLLMGGRYADRLEKRGREWRLIERNVFFQWTQELPEDPELITRFRLMTHRPDKAGELFAALTAQPH